MSDQDVFAPPPDEPILKPRPGLCRAFGPQGERCYLYWDHEASYHWDGHVKWLSEDEYVVRH